MKLRRRLPLFVGIFATMMATLLLVQLLNLALVILVPPPRPPVTTISRIALALRGARLEELRSVPADLRLRDTSAARSAQLRHALAAALRLSESEVRFAAEDFRRRRPPPFLMRRAPRPLDPLPFRAAWRDPSIVEGEFIAAARIGGRWRSVASARSEISPWRWRAVGWLGIAILVVAPLAWLLARALARPIGVFATAAERLGRDLKAPPLALDGSIEIANAAAAFNEMQARLARYVEDRTTLMGAIAHDLRTPLMRLRLRLEGASPEAYAACEPDIRDMEQMIASVMGFVRDMQERPRRRLDLRALAESVAHHFVDSGAEVVIEDGPPVILDGDAAGLKTVFTNLIGNAVKYAGHARVSLGNTGDEAVIDVCDSGPGMDPADLDRAFEPFFRGERSRNRATGGIGLGLASVRAVVRAHGGDAEIANRPEGGLRVRLTLPLSPLRS